MHLLSVVVIPVLLPVVEYRDVVPHQTREQDPDTR